jgi:hypothetical protein
MTPPTPGHHDAAGPNGPEQPIPHPSCLPELRNCQQPLSILLPEIDVVPDSLDPQAGLVHDKLVVRVYNLMRTEVAHACGERWEEHDRQRFRESYQAVAQKWPAYREALAELARVRDGGVSVVDAMVRLEGPRSAYISALWNFYGEFSGTLDFFFPP